MKPAVKKKAKGTSKSLLATNLPRYTINFHTGERNSLLSRRRDSPLGQIQVTQNVRSAMSRTPRDICHSNPTTSTLLLTRPRTARTYRSRTRWPLQKRFPVPSLHMIAPSRAMSRVPRRYARCVAFSAPHRLSKLITLSITDRGPHG
jgi:hypothetical protein